MSTFFRTHKNPDNPFVMVDKRPVENPELSWAAKGMLSYLLSRPDDWEVVMQDLINRSTDGEFAVRNIVKELVEAGHIIHREVREKGKFVKHVYDVYEEPTISRFPTSGFPTSGKPRPTNTDYTNTNNMASGENQPSADPVVQTPAIENLSIENQIYIGSENITVPDNKMAQMKDSARLISQGCGSVSEDVFNIAYSFMQSRGIVIPAEDAKGNRKAARKMVSMGVTHTTVYDAVQYMLSKNLTCVDLFSVQKIAIDLANPPEVKYNGAIEGID